MRMLTHRIPAVLLPVALILGMLGTALLLRTTTLLDVLKDQAVSEMAKPTAIVCTYQMVSRSGMRHVRPLVEARASCESPRFSGLEASIDRMVSDLRAAGVVNAVSVYLRDQERGDWMTYNDAETYDPGSLLKVPTLMGWLEWAEEDPRILDRKLVLTAEVHTGTRKPELPDQGIRIGQPYTVAELLEYMVVRSDNQATGLLNRNIAPERMLKVYSELGLRRPEMKASRHEMTCRDYSTFMIALHHAGYLGPRASETALDMLTRTTFDRGFRAGLPEDIEIAHKFGEGGGPEEKQLHETALVFLKDEPYVLTVMTKGRDMNELAGVLEGVGRLVHSHVLGSRPTRLRH